MAFPGQSWISAVGSKGELLSRQSSRCIHDGKLYLSSTTPSRSVDNNQSRSALPEKQPELLSIRGGEESLLSEREVIRRYLQSLGTSSTSLDNFQIHGWRWHTRSLIREVGRLHTLAAKSSLSGTKQLQEATDYVIDFNLRGLHKVEADLFFPWMRQQLTSRPNDRDVSKAFSAAMTELEEDRLKVAELGRSIRQNADLAGDSRKPREARSNAIQTVADQSAQLQDYARRMMVLEDSCLVPGIAALVPEKEQKSFNNKVLRGLGILDSRLHLVSMYEAVTADENSLKEEKLFQQAIPSVPQMMIPRWKRKLYAPKTYMLE